MTVSRNIACIGAGYWGKNLVRNFDAIGALAWICEADRDRHAALSKEYPGARVTASVEEVLGDLAVEGVAIATPAETHGELVRKALLAGKDVFVEKPLCLSIAEGEELVALAESKRRLLMVGHLLWYHPAVLRLKRLIDEGDIGRIQYIYSNRLNLGKFRTEENILWSFAPHDVSVILGLVGEMPNVIHAQGGNYLHDQIADVTVSLLAFPSGVRAHIFVSWLHPFKEQKLVVVGDRKMAVFNDVEKTDKLLLYPHSINWKKHMPVASKGEAEPVEFDAGEPLRAECEHFLECIRTRQTPRTDGREGLRVLKVLQGCQDALEAEGSAPAPAPAERSGAPAEKAARAPARSADHAAPPAKKPYSAHESVFIDDGVEIGAGTSIWHVSHVLKGSRIGKDCRIGQNVVIGPKAIVGDRVKIQNNVSVYEGVTIEDDVFCGPSMVFTNVMNPRSEIRRMHELRSTLVRRGATLGANSTIVCGTTIGQYGFVGAGTVVVKDVPDFALVVGNPGRVVGWMCVCGNRIRFDKDEKNGSCSSCEKKYSKTEKAVTLNA